MGKTILVIPDSHAHPDFSNERYTWLGHLISDTHPDYVLDIGDFYDFPSLSSYDRGKTSFEGRRYFKDVAAGHEAQDRINTVLKQKKKKLPKKFRTLGNHCHRIQRAIELDSILEGTIGLSDLESKEYGWEEIPFLVPLVIQDVRFQHYFTTGVKNLPVGGNHQAFTLLAKEHSSCVMGHTHTLDRAIQPAGGKFIQSAVVGCYVDYHMDWAGPSNGKWNRGIYIMKDVENGMWNDEWISIDKLKATYGDTRVN